MTFALSAEQQRVVDHRGGHLQVIACAGSGKTESLSRRIAALIAEGAEPASIIAFTFTEKAARELKERAVRRVAEELGADFRDRLGPMFVGTIHGYCFRLLQDHVPRFGNYDVLDEHRHAGLLSREHRRLGLSKLGHRHWRPIRDFLRTVDVIGNELIPLDALAETALGECYADYLEMLERYHFLTFALLISRAVEELENPVVHQRVHSPLRYLFVDEYQDINPAQERLIELLSKPPVQLCVVGDDDQSIYQWRGSDVSNILTFTTRRSPVTDLSLSTNRRSRPKIVESANRFAHAIQQRLPKKMRPTRKSGKNEVSEWRAPTAEEEAEIIAQTIERLHNLGYQYRDIGVLYRSVRTSAPPLVEALQARSIPFSCGGRTGLFQQPDINLFGEIFAWFIDGDWREERFGETRKADLSNIVDGLNKQFGRGKKIRGLKKYLEDWKSFQLKGARSVSLVGDFYKLLLTLGGDQIDIQTPAGSARFGAFARFSQVLADFEHVNRRGRYVEEDGTRTFRGGRDRGKPYFRGLANHLLHYARDAYEDFSGEQTVDLDAVDIVTVHQAKGLEWPVVFMPALTSKRFPSFMSGRSQDWLLDEEVFPEASRRRYEGGDEEERRLFYVAMTRARDALYLSYFERKKQTFKPSPYLVDVAGDKIPRRKKLPLPQKPSQIADLEAAPLEISFSEVASFEDCGHRYRLSTVLGFQQELAVELGYGKAIHHVLRQIAEDARAKGVIPSADELKELVDAEFYLPFANKPAFAQMYQAANRLVGRYIEKHSGDLQRVWATERPFALHLDDGIVAGRADVILDLEDGRPDSLAIVDYKTASASDRDERYRLQLAIYAAAGQGEGLTVEGAYLHELKTGERLAVDIESKTLEAAKQRISSLISGIRQAQFNASPEQKKCQICDFLQVCHHRHDQSDPWT